MNGDISELLAYAHQVEFSVDHIEEDLSKVVERGALNIKRGARSHLKSWSRLRYLKHYHRSIEYEMLNTLEAEVGPDASKPQGEMGRGVEFGSVHTPPAPHLLAAADEEEVRFGRQAVNVLWKGLR